MRLAVLLAAPLLIAAAGDMRVSTFLQKATALRAKGPLALISTDFRLLKNEAGGAANAWVRDVKAAGPQGDKRFGCPAKGTKISYGEDEIMSDLRAVPAAARPRTTVKQAIYAGMRRRYPCR